MEAEEIHKNVVATLKEMIVILKLAITVKVRKSSYHVLFFTYDTNAEPGVTINFGGLCKLLRAVCRKNDPNGFDSREVSPVYITIYKLFETFKLGYSTTPNEIYWFPILDEDEELARSERITFLETILKSIEHSKQKE